MPAMPQSHFEPVTRGIALNLLALRRAVLARLAAVGLLLGAVARRMRRRRIGTAFRGVMLTLALLAVLPAVVPYDHLFVEARAGHEGSHSDHCHGTPGQCADAPIPSGPGQVLTSEPLIAMPAMLSLLMLVMTPALTGITRRPELRPPLRMSSI